MPVAVKIKGYSFRHGGSKYNYYRMANWSLSGSNDGAKWETISNHENESYSLFYNYTFKEPSKPFQYYIFRTKGGNEDGSYRLAMRNVVFKL